ncbi:MAG TPA: hypothetical protein VFD61_00830 [Gaiellales bacterium]|nr:hypothetical protein [Gaiellales bacterium]
MWRLVLLCAAAIPVLAVGCSTELRHGSGPDVSVSVTKAGNGDLVAHLSSTTWPSCAKTLRVSLDGREALRGVPVTAGRFDFALHVSDGDALAIQSICRGSSTSALNDWSTVIHPP